MQRWLSKHLYGMGLLLSDSHDVAVLVYFVLLLPGVLAHELSHWITAKLLRVPVGKIRLGPSQQGGGVTRLGSVSMSRTDPLRASLIGLAPLVTGSILILIIAYYVFGLPVTEELNASVLPGDLRAVMESYLAVPNFWLWVYLVFAISNAMLPSESDRQAWLTLTLYCCVAVVVLYGLGLLQEISSPLSAFLLKGLNYLTFAFLLTIVVDAVVIVVVVILERVVMTVTGKQVEY